MYLVYGLAAIPAGFLADRFGSRRMLVVAAAGCRLSLLLIAAAPSFPLLAGGLVAAGRCAPASTTPAGCRCCRAGWPPASAAGPSASTAPAATSARPSPRPGRACFATTVGWRFGFVAAAALSLACAVLAMSLARPADSHRQLRSARPRTPMPRRGFERRPCAPWDAPCAGFAGNRPLRWLLLSLVATGFVYRGFLTFLPLHLADARAAGRAPRIVMSAVLVAGIVAQRFGGELADRRSRERLYLLESVRWAAGPGAAGPDPPVRRRRWRAPWPSASAGRWPSRWPTP